VREDPINPDLLYVGSEFGLFVSFDAGRTWIAYRNEFPTVAVRDIQIHPRDHDLLVGTHGRGLWVLDDITALQRLTPEVLASSGTLFDIRPATLYSYKSNSMYSGPYAFTGPNPRPGAQITYYIGDNSGSRGGFSLAVFDASGGRVATLRGPRGRGLHRVTWNLRAQGAAQEAQAPARGRYRRFSGGSYCLPGEYTVVLEIGGTRIEKPLTVKPDPRHTFSLDDRRRNQEFVRELGALNQSGMQLIRGMEALGTQIKDVESRLKAAEISDQALIRKLRDVARKVEKIQTAYSYSVEGRTGYRRPVMVALRGGTLPEQLSRLRGSVSRYQGPPTQTQIEHFNEIKGVVEPLLDLATEIRETDIPELNRMLNALNFPVIK
jgi:hypothetical protein